MVAGLVALVAVAAVAARLGEGCLPLSPWKSGVFTLGLGSDSSADRRRRRLALEVGVARGVVLS